MLGRRQLRSWGTHYWQISPWRGGQPSASSRSATDPLTTHRHSSDRLPNGLGAIRPTSEFGVDAEDAVQNHATRWYPGDVDDAEAIGTTQLSQAFLRQLVFCLDGTPNRITYF